MFSSEKHDKLITFLFFLHNSDNLKIKLNMNFKYFVDKNIKIEFIFLLISYSEIYFSDITLLR